MNRFLTLTAIAVAGGLSLAGGSADAAPAQLPAGCTFEKGNTTCVAIESYGEDRDTGEACELLDPEDGVITVGVVIERFEVEIRTVTMFKGKNTDREPLSIGGDRTDRFVGSTCVAL